MSIRKLSIAALAAVALASAADAQRTTRRNIDATTGASQQAQSTEAAATDTIASPGAHDVDINGYDKPQRSRRETFFATNNSKNPLAGFAFTITYLDSSNRMLHRAHHSVAVDIPAGETRQVSIRSWDPQQNFYYRRSTASSRAEHATPYDVKIAVDTLFVRK